MVPATGCNKSSTFCNRVLSQVLPENHRSPWGSYLNQQQTWSCHQETLPHWCNYTTWARSLLHACSSTHSTHTLLRPSHKRWFYCHPDSIWLAVPGQQQKKYSIVLLCKYAPLSVCFGTPFQHVPARRGNVRFVRVVRRGKRVLRTRCVCSRVFIADLSTLSHLNAKLTLETEKYAFCETQFTNISVTFLLTSSYTFVRQLCVSWRISD